MVKQSRAEGPDDVFGGSGFPQPTDRFRGHPTNFRIRVVEACGQRVDGLRRAAWLPSLPRAQTAVRRSVAPSPSSSGARGTRLNACDQGGHEVGE